MGSGTFGRRFAGVLAAGLGVVAISAGGASAAGTIDCGNHKPFAKNLTAKNTTCKKAERVMNNIAVGFETPGWTCEGYPKVTCRKGDAVVKFTALQS